LPVETAGVNEQYSYDVEATDPDDANETLTFSLANPPYGMEIDPSTGMITWTPRSNQTGQHQITVMVSDGLEFQTQAFNVTVSGHESTVGISPWTIVIVSVVVVGGVLGSVVAGTEFGKYKFILFFIPLYTRLKKEKVLEHFTRGRIYGYIQANPGEHLNAIKRALEINNGAIVYHLNTLERMGYIKSRIDRSYKRFYPTKVKIPERSMGELIQIQKDIVRAIKDSPGISQKDIAAKLDISKQLVNYHIKILADAGFVVIKSDGKSVRYHLADDLNI
jgi:predicted transcriptional regulator